MKIKHWLTPNLRLDWRVQRPGLQALLRRWHCWMSCTSTGKIELGAGWNRLMFRQVSSYIGLKVFCFGGPFLECDPSLCISYSIPCNHDGHHRFPTRYHCLSLPSPTMPSQPTAPPNFSSILPIVSFFPGSAWLCSLAAFISATAASFVSAPAVFQDGSEETYVPIASCCS